MATEQTILNVVNMLFQSPLANKPKPLPGQTELVMIEKTARLFAITLIDIDDDLLRAAVTHHLATQKWFPAVADIRTAALSLVHRADGIPSSFEAWEEIKAFRPVSPLAIRAINLLGGIDEFRMSQLSEEPSWRARFIQCYEQLQRRQAEDAMMLPAVTGYIEKRRELANGSVQELIAGVAKDRGIK